jgi:hypothetical protein
MIIIKKVLTGEVITEYKDASWSEIKNDITGNCLEIYSVEYENDNLIVYVF